MLITEAQIENYKGFLSSPAISFGTGFNVVVGQNDAGKTALLEALSLTFSHSPHRSLKTNSNGNSQVRLTVRFGPDEIREIIRKAGTVMIDFVRGNEDSTEARFRKLIAAPIHLEAVFRNGRTAVSASLREYPLEQDIQGVFIFRWDDGANDVFRVSGAHSGTRLTEILTNTVTQRLYAFKAERLNIGNSGFGGSRTLSTNAENLPEVLNVLQSSNPARFERFNGYVHEIFPTVEQIRVRPDRNGLGIVVWSVNPNTEREDLAIPLEASGTGIGQVLAILYVTLTSTDPQVILIDEPQSFLHPGATRKLLAILKSHSHHQFIITTHTPYAVADVVTGTVTLIRKSGMESIVQPLNSSAASDLQLLLSEVGVRISDVFGAENILWVEGSTEELCFPGIIAGVAKTPLLGTVILGVENTGDFETRRRGLNAFAVYERLSASGGLLPRAIGFIFDREGRTELEREDLIRRSAGKVSFLPRRLYENYLIHPAAIASIISSLEGFRGPHSPDDISVWLNTNRWEKRFFSGGENIGGQSDEFWLERGDGAKLLAALFTTFSGNTVEYRKKEHGLMLTEWIIENDPEHLRELANLVTERLARR